MLLKDSTLHDVHWSSILGTGVTLVIHASHIQNDAPLKEYCAQFDELVDRTILVSSLNAAIHVYGAVFNPTWITLWDDKQHWLEDWSKRNSSSLIQSDLAVQLKCQQVWKDGVLVDEWHKPLEDPWSHFKQWIAEHSNPHLWLQSQFPTQSAMQWFRRQCKIQDPRVFESNIRTKWIEHEYQHQHQIMAWYRLIPNPSLEQLIFEINNAVS